MNPLALKSAEAPQRGVALIVVLLFMATLAVGGLYSARSALLGERLARNQLDNQVARQAAEAALRDAEVDLSLPTGVKRDGAKCERGNARPVELFAAGFTPDCRQGQCSALNPASRLNANFATATKDVANAEAWWPTDKGGKWNDDGNKTDCDLLSGGVPIGTYTGAEPITGVRRQPQYLIERIPKNEQGEFYRITARGFGFRDGTEVVMQTYFLVAHGS